MTTVVIVALMSFLSWIAITTLMKSAEISRNRSMAVNLLQKSQEEIRRVNLSLFDTLENCQFPVVLSGNTCGFEDTTSAFPGFTRVLKVSQEGSPELKRALITVSWSEFGQTKQLDSIVLLSRPPTPLPGNIIGTVKSSAPPNSLLDGINITITRNNTTEVHTTRSTNVLSSKNANFDFAESGADRFILDPDPQGYTLTASDPSNRYFPYTHPTPVKFGSLETARVDFSMDSKPVDGTITGSVIDRNTGQLISAFTNASIRLFDDGATAANVSVNTINGQRVYSTKVNFSNNNPRCFTVNTSGAYAAGYAYSVGAAGAPSCNFLYQSLGWSSAVMQKNGSLACSNAWNGAPASDRVCLSSGQSITQDILVEPVPEVIITGLVVDSSGNPIPNATVSALWPRNAGSVAWRKGAVTPTVKTDAQGRFTYSVPAVQGLFPNTTAGTQVNDLLQVKASATLSVLSCCQVLSNELRTSPTIFVGPLFPGDGPRDIGTLVIPSSDKNCGNATGTIAAKDVAGSPVPDAIITITGPNELTDALGKYLFACPSGVPAYKIPTGNYNFIANKTGFYRYDTGGNSFWYALRPAITIQKNLVTTYNARLWPRGSGTIKVKVVDKGQQTPIPNINVRLTYYDGTTQTAKTDSEGKIDSFSNVPETWPPDGLPATDPYYKHTALGHSISASDSTGIYLPIQQTISSLKDGQTLEIKIELVPQGNL